MSISDKLTTIANNVALVYQAGYEKGLASGGGGSSADLEALGVLCDWQVMMNSDSRPTITIINYHPSYYLHCDITSTMDGETYHIVVDPDDSISHMESVGSRFDGGQSFDVTNVRWKASADS